MRALRRTVTPAARAAASRALCERLLARAEIAAAIAARRPIAVYLASADELDLADFIAVASRRGALLVAPRWTGADYALAPLAADGSAPVVGPHGIREPSAPSADFSAAHPRLAAEVAVWIVPGLAFTADGTRLGYGGGWYDRLLAESDPASARLGVCYAFQLVEDLPSEPHDIRMTEIIL